MSDQKNHLMSKIIAKANFLDTFYCKEFNFRNHCYLRIAFDKIVGDKWDTKIAKPFVKNASQEQLKNVLLALDNYETNKQILQDDNLKSLHYRQKHRLIEESKNPKLF